jgi:hypothetical protein
MTATECVESVRLAIDRMSADAPDHFATLLGLVVERVKRAETQRNEREAERVLAAGGTPVMLGTRSHNSMLGIIWRVVDQRDHPEIDWTWQPPAGTDDQDWLD